MEFQDLPFGAYFSKVKAGGPTKAVFRKLIEPKSKPIYYVVDLGAKSIRPNINCVDDKGRLMYMDITTKVVEMKLQKVYIPGTDGTYGKYEFIQK